MEAIDVIEGERESVHRGFEIDGVVTDKEAIELIDQYDRWLTEAKAQTRDTVG